jgi:hypothetical protein
MARFLSRSDHSSNYLILIWHLIPLFESLSSLYLWPQLKERKEYFHQLKTVDFVDPEVDAVKKPLLAIAKAADFLKESHHTAPEIPSSIKVRITAVTLEAPTEEDRSLPIALQPAHDEAFWVCGMLSFVSVSGQLSILSPLATAQVIETSVTTRASFSIHGATNGVGTKAWCECLCGWLIRTRR